MKRNLTYTLEVLTPIHVGSGQQLMPSEYLLDNKNRKFFRINMGRLFQSPDFDFETYISLINRGHFYLGDRYLEAGISNTDYELDATGSINELSLNVGRASGFVLEFIKEGGKPYLPGSSLKGSLRSLVVRYIIRNNRRRYEDTLDRQLQEMAERRRRVRAEFFSTPAEQALTGKPNNSVFRTLQIGDSLPISFNDMCLSYVKVISQSGNAGFRWKDLGSRINLNRCEKATAIFFEAIKPGTRVTGRVRMDDFLFNEDVARLLHFNRNGLEAMSDLANTCNAEAREVINGEIKFFREVNFSQGVTENERLLCMLSDLKSDEFLLPLAWGTGYRNKAAGETINPHLFGRIRGAFRLGRDNMLFPKSRKIVFEFGEPATVCGWSRVKLLEA